MGINSQFYIATLDAIPSSVVLDISFSLGCIDDLKIAYMSPYSQQVPPSVDVYTVGMWNRRTGAWVNDETHEYRNPVITDDGASVYLSNQAQLRQIVESMRSAIRTATPGLVLSMGMYDSTDKENQGLWGEFDPKGLQDALQYLPCFNPTEMPAPTPSPTPTSAPSPVETKWSVNEADGDPSVFLMDRGNGPVRMMVVDCASDEGSARWLALRLSGYQVFPLPPPFTKVAITHTIDNGRSTTVMWMPHPDTWSSKAETATDDGFQLLYPSKAVGTEIIDSLLDGARHIDVKAGDLTYSFATPGFPAAATPLLGHCR